MSYKRKYIWAFLDGEPFVEVIQAALDNNLMVSELKEKLIKENPNHKVDFRITTTNNIKEVSING
jgi:hypothetical protein